MVPEPVQEIEPIQEPEPVKAPEVKKVPEIVSTIKTTIAFAFTGQNRFRNAEREARSAALQAEFDALSNYKGTGKVEFV